MRLPLDAVCSPFLFIFWVAQFLYTIVLEVVLVSPSGERTRRRRREWVMAARSPPRHTAGTLGVDVANNNSLRVHTCVFVVPRTRSYQIANSGRTSVVPLPHLLLPRTRTNTHAHPPEVKVSFLRRPVSNEVQKKNTKKKAYANL